ncbi:peptidoglycan recognition protein family protein [Staphylococcus pseudintermedius]|uniref:peptidoglycan recognition protein family protein n=1 Tax=Staphylococcus pseudintermedius TaxID=283734 RepID=UPI002927E5E1|nr:N-acetylmuramoyl-L-alanine amidase [Staphylococcus pseudintermedius]MDU9311831.1 autolysin [Staphylococcus pseudintermedius]
MLKGFTTMALSTVMTLSTLCFVTTNVARTFFTTAFASTTSLQTTILNPQPMPNHQNLTLQSEQQQSRSSSEAFLPIPYPDVNQYIMKNHIPHSPVVKDARMNTLPKIPYKYGTYIGVVIHEVGEDDRTLPQWVDRMYRTYDRAFVHAFVDEKEIRLTAPSNYLAWGAGKQANPYFYHIELVRVYSFDDFARSVNNQAWLAAYMLKQQNIEPTLADDQEGVGSVISHYAIMKYWGGTTHTDPIAYYNRWNYNMEKFFELVKYHYEQMEDHEVVTDKEE